MWVIAANEECIYCFEFEFRAVEKHSQLTSATFVRVGSTLSSGTLPRDCSFIVDVFAVTTVAVLCASVTTRSKLLAMEKVQS